VISVCQRIYEGKGTKTTRGRRMGAAPNPGLWPDAVSLHVKTPRLIVSRNLRARRGALLLLSSVTTAQQGKYANGSSRGRINECHCTGVGKVPQQDAKLSRHSRRRGVLGRSRSASGWRILNPNACSTSRRTRHFGRTQKSFAANCLPLPPLLILACPVRGPSGALSGSKGS